MSRGDSKGEGVRFSEEKKEEKEKKKEKEKKEIKADRKDGG